MSGLVAIIDAEDALLVNQYKWRADKSGNTFYACRGYGSHKLPKKWMIMHRLIMGAGEGYVVDHINGDGLDNRKSNLRLCTRSENNRHRVNLFPTNKSGVNGVYWAKTQNKWIATININKKQKTLGSFIDKEDAVAARRAAEIEHYGEYAPVVQLIDKDKYIEPPTIVREIKRVKSTHDSGVVGVTWCKTRSRWIARMSAKFGNGKSKYIGTFVDMNDAIIAKKEAELSFKQVA